jgi:hypothetical protein
MVGWLNGFVVIKRNCMRTIFFLILLLFFGINSFAQNNKMMGFGGELSVLGLNPNVRMWISKTTGFEVFGGISSEMTEFKPNDFEAGFKLLSTFLYNRKNRTYFGLVGKWKWVNIDSEININTSLPVGGILIGKEWYSKRLHKTGFAVEFGYQYGSKKYNIPEVEYQRVYDEFPLILNFRYSFYQKR